MVKSPLQSTRGGTGRSGLLPTGCGSTPALWFGQTEDEGASNRLAELVHGSPLQPAARRPRSISDSRRSRSWGSPGGVPSPTDRIARGDLRDVVASAELLRRLFCWLTRLWPLLPDELNRPLVRVNRARHSCRPWRSARISQMPPCVRCEDASAASPCCRPRFPQPASCRSQPARSCP